MENSFPSISGDAMAAIDRIMMEELGVETLQLMELAGYGVADVARRHGGLDLRSRSKILLLAGTGGNGGDAMVSARLLAAWGADTTVILARPRGAYTGIAAHQLGILDRMNIAVHEPEGLQSLPGADLVIDGLLGFSLRGDPHGETARLIELTNAHSAPTLAIDLPSGLDATSGRVGTTCIRAAMTVTLAMPKTGLMLAPKSLTGHIWVADIGVPPWVYARVNVDVPGDLFASESVVRVR